MLRKCVCAVTVLVLVAGLSLADEIKGKIKKVDAEKSVITLTVGEKDQNIRVQKDTKLLGADGKELADGVKSKDLAEGTEVIVTFEREGNRRIIKQIKISKK